MVVVELLSLSLPATEAPFDLSKAVCSHGLFMMAPNRWDPPTGTLERPLRLPLSSSSSSTTPVTVRISQPSHSSLLVSVLADQTLSLQDQESILAQVRRMLRISEETDRMIADFHEAFPAAKEKGFGRLFRSPTLFEDMVKCMLLCNCQWPRTLSMVRALCELQIKLQSHSATEYFHPKTPQSRELKRKCGEGKKVVTRLEIGCDNNETDISDVRSMIISETKTDHPQVNELFSSTLSCNFSNSCQSPTEDISFSSAEIGDFPTPEELAKLDPVFLAECCRLGYRAQRIIALAKSVVNKTLRLDMLERVSDGYAASSYEEIDKQLSTINGFGPYTRANVLMCMGFYNRIPADTETVRHLKTFHKASRCTISSIWKDMEAIYGKYGSFQYLAYWFELWHDYERRFGNFSELSASDYRLFTASNMKNNVSRRSRKTRD